MATAFRRAAGGGRGGIDGHGHHGPWERASGGEAGSGGVRQRELALWRRSGGAGHGHHGRPERRRGAGRSRSRRRKRGGVGSRGSAVAREVQPDGGVPAEELDGSRSGGGAGEFAGENSAARRRELSGSGRRKGRMRRAVEKKLEIEFYRGGAHCNVATKSAERARESTRTMGTPHRPDDPHPFPLVKQSRPELQNHNLLRTRENLISMATKLRCSPRLLPILSTFFLVRHIAAALPSTDSHHPYVDQTSGVNPVILLPGTSCSQIEVRLTDAYEPPSPVCAARKGDGQWSLLYKNITAPDAEVSCFVDQLRLVYDHAGGDYRNARGVETRALAFGSTRGFLANDPADKELCMGKLVEALEQVGYRDGKSLFGAPYDFRHAPAAPGQANRALSRFRRQLRALVERASGANGGRPVVLVSHSQGGYFAMDFLRHSPVSWRRRFVKHFVMASTGAGGFVLSTMQFIAGSSGNSSSSTTSPATVLSLPRVGRTLANRFTALPSPVAFGDDMPLVVTRNKSYAARDMPAFLAAAGLPPYVVRLYETRDLPVALKLGAPGVPVTCVNGVGVPTLETLVYRDGFDGAPEVVYGDGDGVVNLASIVALDAVIGGDPRQEYYRSVRIADMSHVGVVSDPFALQRLIGEILAANRVVDTRVM